MSFGKGYGSRKSFGAPVFQKQFVQNTVQPMFNKGMAFNNMYASSPVVSAGSIGHYPAQNNMYSGMSSMSSYPQVGGISHMGTVSSVGSYPQYNTGNIY